MDIDTTKSSEISVESVENAAEEHSSGSDSNVASEHKKRNHGETAVVELSNGSQPNKKSKTQKPPTSRRSGHKMKKQIPIIVIRIGDDAKCEKLTSLQDLAHLFEYKRLDNATLQGSLSHIKERGYVIEQDGYFKLTEFGNEHYEMTKMVQKSTANELYDYCFEQLEE